MGADYSLCMQTALLIDLAHFPEEGKNYEGELDSSIFSFPDHDDAKPLSPMKYSLFAQRFESEMLLQGSLSATFEFTCVVTLERFVKTIALEQIAVSIEIEKGGFLDVTDALREEIIVEMPVNPRCDEGDEPRECKINSPHFVVDKTVNVPLESPPPPQADHRWAALDVLQQDLQDNN